MRLAWHRDAAQMSQRVLASTSASTTSDLGLGWKAPATRRPHGKGKEHDGALLSER
jgi:hypothetical protein